MKKFLFSSKAVRTLAALCTIALLGAGAALPVAAAQAETTSIYATAQGTSLLGTPVPILGTRGWTLTLPISSKVLPQFVWGALDFTVTSQLTLGNTRIYYLDLDPRML